jgi:hypothetical protein
MTIQDGLQQMIDYREGIGQSIAAIKAEPLPDGSPIGPLMERVVLNLVEVRGMLAENASLVEDMIGFGAGS